MRDIIFRGKCAFSGYWRYGYYYISKGNHIIRDSEDNESIVLEATVSQYTGLIDKKGKMIFGGDIVTVEGTKRIGVYTTVIIESRHGFTLKENKTYINDDSCLIGVLEVIGNIHEQCATQYSLEKRK